MRLTDKDSFKRLAVMRVNKALKHIKLVGNLSNKSNYSYTDKQVKKIFAALREGINDAEERFEQREKPNFILHI